MFLLLINIPIFGIPRVHRHRGTTMRDYFATESTRIRYTINESSVGLSSSRFTLLDSAFGTLDSLVSTKRRRASARSRRAKSRGNRASKIHHQTWKLTLTRSPDPPTLLDTSLSRSLRSSGFILLNARASLSLSLSLYMTAAAIYRWTAGAVLSAREFHERDSRARPLVPLIFHS